MTNNEPRVVDYCAFRLSITRGAFGTCEGTIGEGQECVRKEGHARRSRRLLGEGDEDTRERVKIGGGRASATRRPEPYKGRARDACWASNELGTRPRGQGGLKKEDRRYPSSVTP